MQYNKLVRDRIPEIIKNKWDFPKVRILSDSEYSKELYKKLQEEVDEFLISPDNIEELADIMEVLYAICDFKKISVNEIEKIRLKKKEKKWWFNRRIFLEEV